MSEFVAALIGAIVGGVTTFWATWWQTKRVLNHERDMAQKAADAQRRASRQAVDQESARELLPWLVEMDKVLPEIARGDHLYMETGKRANSRMQELLDLQHSTVALLSSPGTRLAWEQLRILTADLASAWEIYSETDSDRVFSDGWTQQKVSRAQADVSVFIGYVRAHLLAVIDESAPPLPVELLPVLHRQDMSVWRPPS